MESEIRQLVNQHIKDFAVCEGLHVIWPNRPPGDDYQDNPTTKPDAKYTHLIVRWWPTTPRVLHPCDGSGIRTWILQITVKIRDSIGELVATRIVDKLALHFPVNTQFAGENHCYRVIKPADPKQPMNIDAWQSTPVQFRISAFT